MAKEILFIHPPSPMLEKQKMVPPLGALQLMAVLREGGHESLSLLDVGNEHIDIEQLLSAQYLLFSATTPQYSEALKIVQPVIEREKEKNSKRPILAIGGPHATYMGKKLLEDGWNYVCQGEGEKIINPLVEGKINEGLVVGERVENLDERPIPAYDLLEPGMYRRSDEYGPTYPAMSSRGCPFNCSFCYKLTGRAVRYHSPGYILNVGKEIMRNNVNQMVFYDDTFTLRPDRVNEISKNLRSLGIAWRCNAHVNTLTSKMAKDKDMLSRMKDGGCVLVSIGIDGIDKDSLSYLGKGTSVERGDEAVRLVKEAGILAKVYLIYIPGRGVKYVEGMKNFINRTEPDIVGFSVLMPLPGSAIYEHPKKFGLKMDKNNINELFYQGKDGEYGNALVLTEEDKAALEDFYDFLRDWRKTKPRMPI